jgi:hypothetical protein
MQPTCASLAYWDYVVGLQRLPFTAAQTLESHSEAKSEPLFFSEVAACLGFLSPTFIGVRFGFYRVVPKPLQISFRLRFLIALVVSGQFAWVFLSPRLGLGSAFGAELLAVPSIFGFNLFWVSFLPV